MKNCRILSINTPSAYEDWETVKNKICQLLNIPYLSLQIQYEHTFSPDLHYLLEGYIVLKQASGQTFGQISYKIPKQHSLLFISYVSTENNLFNIEIQIMISNNLIEFFKPKAVSYASENLAKAHAQRLDQKLGRTEEGNYWGFILRN
jgi:hypothetical protein